MILNQQSVGILSNIILDFEVAYRSLVVKKVYDECSTIVDFERKIQQIRALYHGNTTDTVPLNYMKMKNKISTYNSKKVRNVFGTIENTMKSYSQKKLVSDEDVLMVNELIELILFFYKPIFEDLGTKFGGGDTLEQELNFYKDIRNASSHRGSKIISHNEAIRVLKFISKNIEILEDDYFWYVSKTDLNKEINNLMKKIKIDNRIKHNLYQVNKKHKILLEREDEYSVLRERILGKTGSLRKSGTVLIQGSGGVGKTALALELCYEVLSRDEQYNIDFILFLTSKEEELSYNSVTGEIRLDILTPKFKDLKDIESSLSELFSINNKTTPVQDILSKYSGLIVLDNFETIDVNEQQKINDFISKCSNNIQFILTSRPTETILENYILEVPLNLRGLDEDKAKQFILDYLDDYGYIGDIRDIKLQQFAKEACGNPLIMVMGLQRICDNLISIEELIETLRNYSSSEVDTISAFMYKNMMEETIKSLEDEHKQKNLVNSILTSMYIYDDPIDIYSIRDITKLDAKEIEIVLKELQRKYIVFKQSGLYKLDDLAIKFILIKKILPSKIPYLKLKTDIVNYKNDIKVQLKKLEVSRKQNKTLDIIISNWSPNSYSEEIAIAQAFNYFDYFKKKISRHFQSGKIDSKKIFLEITEKFEALKFRGNHPYITFQQARVLKNLLSNKFNDIDPNYRKIKEKIIEEIKNSYSEAHYIISSTHTYFLNSKSHAALLLQYGAFMLDSLEVEEGVKLLEEAIIVYNEHFGNDNGEDINRYNAYYYIILGELALGLSDIDYLLDYAEEVKGKILILKDLEKRISKNKINDCYLKEKRVRLVNLFVDMVIDKEYIPKEVDFEYFDTNKNTWMTTVLKQNKFIIKLEEIIEDRMLLCKR